MSTPRLEVQWSPVHPDRFITWGTEIFLYETVEIKEETKASCVFLSDNTVAHLLASNSNHHYVKCVDIYPHPQPDVLLAIGQANGKVVLTSFGSSVFDNMGLTGIEIGKTFLHCLFISELLPKSASQLLKDGFNKAIEQKKEVCAFRTSWILLMT
ncbi:unnamed protein product [Bemisia tabaci]|uniref:Uncharacterized protein n=1 Tax=Bemisia tabaci TaxID=7038 RepID=A0A9P0EV92_BEMTA|nr:unnamed protein product [Bemisia tabaci]